MKRSRPRSGPDFPSFDFPSLHTPIMMPPKKIMRRHNLRKRSVTPPGGQTTRLNLQSPTG